MAGDQKIGFLQMQKIWLSQSLPKAISEPQQLIKQYDPFPILDLPEEIFQTILTILLNTEGAKVFGLASVNKYFQRQLNDKNLVRRWANRHLPTPLPISFLSDNLALIQPTKQLPIIIQSLIDNLQHSGTLADWAEKTHALNPSELMFATLTKLSETNLYYCYCLHLLHLGMVDGPDAEQQIYFSTLKDILNNNSIDDFNTLQTKLTTLDELPEFHPINLEDYEGSKNDNYAIAKKYAVDFKPKLDLLLKLDLTNAPDNLRMKVLFLVLCEFISCYKKDYINNTFSADYLRLIIRYINNNAYDVFIRQQNTTPTYQALRAPALKFEQ